MLLLLLRRLVRVASLWVVVVGLLVFTSGVAGAASYLRTDGGLVDPIQSVLGWRPAIYGGEPRTRRGAA